SVALPLLCCSATARTGIYTLSLHDALPIWFIDVAEETGLISSLGRFVLDRACASLAEWLSTKAFPADFYVSVNVSPKEFYSRDRSEEHTSELQSRENLVCRLLLEKKKKTDQ